MWSKGDGGFWGSLRRHDVVLGLHNLIGKERFERLIAENRVHTNHGGKGEVRNHHNIVHYADPIVHYADPDASEVSYVHASSVHRAVIERRNGLISVLRL